MARKLSDQEVKDLAAEIISSTPELKKLPTDELKAWLDQYKIGYDDEDIKAIEDELVGFYGTNINEARGPVRLISESLRSMVVNENMYGTPIAKLSDLRVGETYVWTGGAELLDIKYIGRSSEHPDKKPGSIMGKGFLFQWVDSGKYMELSFPAIKENVILKEEESVEEGTGRKIKDFPFVMHWSDGVARALGGDTYLDLINAANAKSLKSFAIFKRAPGFHSTSQEQYLVAWYDHDGNGYWSNRAKKEPDLNDRKLNDDFQTPSDIDAIDLNEAKSLKSRDGYKEIKAAYDALKAKDVNITTDIEYDDGRLFFQFINSDGEDIEVFYDHTLSYTTIADGQTDDISIDGLMSMVSEAVVNEADDQEYFDVEAKLRDVCFQQSQQQISNDEAAQQIQEILKDSEELSAVFTNVAPKALVDEVINYYGWTASDLAEAKQEGREGNETTDEIDARFKQICADYYADLLPTADAIEQAKAILDECMESHPDLHEAVTNCDDEDMMYAISCHFGWNAFDLAESRFKDDIRNNR